MRSFECCQLSWCSHTVSARSSAYGIQPIWPSEYASFSFGNWMSLPENSQSASDAIELLKASVPPTPPGASGGGAGVGGWRRGVRRRRADVHAEGDAPVVADLEQRVPVAGVDRRQLEVVG